MRSISRGLTVAAAAAMIAAAPGAAAYAEPPPWAPAHGWRAKHDHGHGQRKDRRQPQGSAYDHYGRPSYSQPVIWSGGRTFACDRSLLSGNKTLLAQILGGAGGAVAGAQFGQGTGKLAATAGGALLGVLIGTELGASLDAADVACAERALEEAETGQSVIWRNPDAGAQYTVLPTRTYEVSGTYCREYTTRAVVGGRSQEAYGTACRQPDGSWRIVR